MKLLVITAFLIVLAFGAHTRTSAAKKAEELKHTKFGRTLLNLMTLHSLVQGPVQELEEAIEELVNDLNEDLEELEFNFQVRTNEHNSYVLALEQEINDAQSDIARMEDVIDNLLIPRRDQISTKIASIQDYSEFNRKNLQEETLLREQEQDNYELLMTEYNDAIDAVDEALVLIANLNNPQLLQIKQLKNTIKRVPIKAWNRVQSGPMVYALVQIAVNQNFSDQGILGQIIDAINEFRNEVVNAINEMTKQEAINAETFIERVNQLNSEFAEFQRQLNAASIELTATNEKLDDSVAFLNQRNQDLGMYNSQLQLENDAFAVESMLFGNMQSAFQQELGVAEQGLALVQSADFSSINV